MDNKASPMSDEKRQLVETLGEMIAKASNEQLLIMYGTLIGVSAAASV